jgi:hypothetical protein
LLRSNFSFAILELRMISSAAPTMRCLVALFPQPEGREH